MRDVAAACVLPGRDQDEGSERGARHVPRVVGLPEEDSEVSISRVLPTSLCQTRMLPCNVMTSCCRCDVMFATREALVWKLSIVDDQMLHSLRAITWPLCTDFVRLLSPCAGQLKWHECGRYCSTYVGMLVVRAREVDCHVGSPAWLK